MTEIGSPKGAEDFKAPKQMLVDAYHPVEADAIQIYMEVRAERLNIPRSAVEKPQWRHQAPKGK